jgi:hypothetical protein
MSTTTDGRPRTKSVGAISPSKGDPERKASRRPSRFDVHPPERLALVALATRWEASAQTSRRRRGWHANGYHLQAQMWDECAWQLRQLLEAR